MAGRAKGGKAREGAGRYIICTSYCVKKLCALQLRTIGGFRVIEKDMAGGSPKQKRKPCGGNF